MNLIYFAHEGVEHTNTTEAVTHSDRLPIILAISVVALVAIFVTNRLLNAVEKRDQNPPKNKESKK